MAGPALVPKTKQRWMEYLADQEAKNRAHDPLWDESPTHFRASSLACPCMLKNQLDYIYGKEFDDTTISKMGLGTELHEIVQQKLYPDKIHEVEVALRLQSGVTGQEVLVTGHIDMIDPEETWEIKSWAYLSKIKKEGPPDYHQRQLNFYMGADCPDHTIPHTGRFVYVQKQDFDIYEYVMPFDQEMFDEFVDDALYLHVCLVQGLVAQHRPGDYCRWCNHKTDCKELKSQEGQPLCQKLKELLEAKAKEEKERS